MEPERKLHVVDEPDKPKTLKGGLTDHFVPRTDDLRWVSFPGLEHFGSEIQIRHTSCKGYARWQKTMEAASKRSRRGATDTDIFRAELPGAVADHLVFAWRTPVRDSEDKDTGEFTAGVPWGGAPTRLPAEVYVRNGKGATRETREFVFDVDPEGYLRSTAENELNLFSVYATALDEVLGLCMDDEVFARPDEEAIRGN